NGLGTIISRLSYATYDSLLMFGVACMNSRNRHKTTSFIASVVIATGLAGCGSTGPAQYQPLTLTNHEQAVVNEQPTYLQPMYKTLFAEGKRNEVLNRMEIGTA